MRRQNRNNLWVRRALLALLVCGVGAPAPLRADDKALQRWEQMPAEERERALKNYETWKSLDAGEREKIRERWERFRALPPERQAEIRDRWDRFQKLSDDEKRALKEKVERWKSDKSGRPEDGDLSLIHISEPTRPY